MPNCQFVLLFKWRMQPFSKRITSALSFADGLAALLSACSHWFLTTRVTFGWLSTSVRLITAPAACSVTCMSAIRQHEQQVDSSITSTSNFLSHFPWALRPWGNLIRFLRRRDWLRLTVPGMVSFHSRRCCCWGNWRGADRLEVLLSAFS